MHTDLFLKYRLETEWYGMPLEEVLRITPLPRIRAVPGAPAIIRGIVEIRGRIITVLDPVRLLGFSLRTESDREVAILWNRPFTHLALMVPELPQVCPARREQVRNRPGRNRRPHLESWKTEDQEPIQVMRCRSLLAFCEEQMALSLRLARPPGVGGGNG